VSGGSVPFARPGQPDKPGAFPKKTKTNKNKQKKTLAELFQTVRVLDWNESIWFWFYCHRLGL
jgi:hypothetical protein